MTDDGIPAGAGDGADGSGARGLVVRPLTHELLGDWLAFFDGDAFADNPDWCDCYCQFFHVGEDAVWESRTAEQNRAASVEMIQARRMHGYLAYLDGRPVGWCHAAPRSQLPRMATDPELAAGDGSRIGAIVCFLIAAPARRREWRPASSKRPAPGSANRGSRRPKPIRRRLQPATRPIIMGRSNCTYEPGSSAMARSETS